MVVLSLTVPTADADYVIADLSEHAIEGIREERVAEGSIRLDVFLEEATAAKSLATVFPAYFATIAPADSRDWVAHSRSMWQPIEVGERFYLIPEWDTDSRAPEDRIALRMPVGQGFGSGFHESTQLALRALEITSMAGETVLDVGTGSGILLAAARELGAVKLVGCDVDPVAIEAAREYVSASHMEAGLFQGSIDAVLPQRFGVVLANLNATLILNLLDELFASLEPRGRLILSGILADEAPVIHGALEKVHGVSRIYHSAQGDWVNFRVSTGT